MKIVESRIKPQNMTQSQIIVTLQSQKVFHKSFSLPDAPRPCKIFQNLRDFLIPEYNIGE